MQPMGIASPHGPARLWETQENRTIAMRAQPQRQENGQRQKWSDRKGRGKKGYGACRRNIPSKPNPIRAREPASTSSILGFPIMRSFYPSRPSDEHSGDHVVVFDIETVTDTEPPDGGFPKWPLHRPVVASFLAVSLDVSRYTFRMTSIVCEPGREAEFYDAVDAELPAGATSIGFNSKGFDLPALQIGAIAERRFELSGLSHHARSHRFGRNHCDLAEMYSLYRSTKTPSLAEICGRLEIPVKTSVHGSDVYALWRAGDIDAIKRYCEEDVAATYCVWLAWHAWRHADEALMTRPLASFARWIEASSDLAHLRPFATSPNAIWARSRALACDVADALATAERRIERAADERAFAGEPPIF